jgi:hypothetical protein
LPWKKVTTSSCFRSDGFVALGLLKLHTSEVDGWWRVPFAVMKPGLMLKLATMVGGGWVETRCSAELAYLHGHICGKNER